MENGEMTRALIWIQNMTLRENSRLSFSLFHSLKCENIIKYDLNIIFPKYDYFHNPRRQWLIGKVETFMFCWFLGMTVHGPEISNLTP